MKPQLVRPKPLTTHAPQSVTQNQKNKLVSPCNNYMEFLQTGSLEMNPTAVKRDVSQKINQKPHNSALLVFEETN